MKGRAGRAGRRGGDGGRGAGRRLADALVDGGVTGLHLGLRAAPEPVALAAGRTLGALCRDPLRVRRRVVDAQLAASFPAATPHWVRDTARACYRHFGREAALLMGGPPRIERTLSRVTDEAGLGPRLHAAIAERGGAAVVAGHLGNWELGGAAVRALGVRVTAVVQRQRGAFGRRLRDLRARLGLDVLDRDAAARPALDALRSGRILALVADQHARRGSVPIDFLGRPAWTSLAPARLCLAADVPLFFAALVRDPTGYRIVHEEIDGAGSRPGDPAEVTKRWVRALEREIERRPEQYFWFHRRWKPVAQSGEQA
ncbi:MAG: lysophospholipid acyltransferase family protein [Gemmatimonadales bacterium]|nr:lysophospholipid acyltransferase family protein [Gemmatimonadales bacterium]MYK03207.1 lysophospholipid acyltransferase family protein [Candidatus Palauibacter ramosifaciens]